MFHRDCGPREREGAGRDWDWRYTNFGEFFFGAKHRRGGPWRGGRMFEQGGLKFVILRLLEEKPRHGYEIIKELEERSGGRYTPSPGTVYPTLTMLEEMGFASAAVEEGGKKVYSITDAGRQHLAENKGALRTRRWARSAAATYTSPCTERLIRSTSRGWWKSSSAHRPTSRR
jgi:DNA-binding PadR family transcriptional regulator